MIERKKTRQVKVGNVIIGGDAPISIQSMVKVPTDDVKAVIKQISELKDAGCEITRVALRDEKATAALRDIMKEAVIPVVADIHFDYRLALAAIDAGVNKVRINPGNIYREDDIAEIIKAAHSAGKPVRIGANSGSILTKKDREKAREQGLTPHATAGFMVDKVLQYVKFFEDRGFDDIVLSLKASSVSETIQAYRLISQRCDYPLHIGVTAAGPYLPGIVRSSIALGALLMEGMGDTIRVSLTGDPVDEVLAAKEMLSALELRSFGPTLISCPTCGRCRVDLRKVVAELEPELRKVNEPIKVAVMGCEVNGPGEASEADIGIACGRDWGAILVHGEIVRRVPADKLVEELLKEIESLRKDLS